MTFTQLLQKNIRFVILAPIVVAGLVFAGSLFKQPLYKSSLSLLVVQQQGEEVDVQAAVKSAEQMADIMSRVVDSEAFRAAVLASDVKVNLPAEPWKRAKQWHKIVKTKNITDTGILIVDVYQPTSAQATKLAAAIQRILTTQGYDYLGVNPETVSLRELNPPQPTNNKPATPNLPLNSAIGWLFGIIISMSLLLLFPNTNWSGFFRFGGKRKETVKHDEEPSGGLIYSEKLVKAVSTTGKSDEAPLDLPTRPEVTFISRAEDILKRQF